MLDGSVTGDAGGAGGAGGGIAAARTQQDLIPYVPNTYLSSWQNMRLPVRSSAPAAPSILLHYRTHAKRSFRVQCSLPRSAELIRTDEVVFMWTEPGLPRRCAVDAVSSTKSSIVDVRWHHRRPGLVRLVPPFVGAGAECVQGTMNAVDGARREKSAD